jgi:hypothetical protein
MELKPVAKVFVRSALPSASESSTSTTLSPGVLVFGLRYCGPLPTQSRPFASKAIEHAWRTSGSRAKNETSKPAGTMGSASRFTSRSNCQPGPCWARAEQHAPTAANTAQIRVR